MGSQLRMDPFTFGAALYKWTEPGVFSNCFYMLKDKTSFSTFLSISQGIMLGSQCKHQAYLGRLGSGAILVFHVDKKKSVCLKAAPKSIPVSVASFNSVSKVLKSSVRIKKRELFLSLLLIVPFVRRYSITFAFHIDSGVLEPVA